MTSLPNFVEDAILQLPERLVPSALFLKVPLPPESAELLLSLVNVQKRSAGMRAKQFRN